MARAGVDFCAAKPHLTLRQRLLPREQVQHISYDLLAEAAHCSQNHAWGQTHPDRIVAIGPFLRSVFCAPDTRARTLSVAPEVSLR